MKIFLVLWAVAAFAWWTIALGLLASRRKQNPSTVGSRRPAIAVFKPLPPVKDERERTALARAVDSFLSQLTARDELIVGVDTGESGGWQSVFQNWKASWPEIRIQVIVRPRPCQCANPKIAWLQVLITSAHAEVWVWSDTDVTAPPGLLTELCSRLSEKSCNAVTAAYAVRNVDRGCGVLDALFVNVEFLPGALLLGRLKKRDFAYGAAIAFRAETFHLHGDWHKLGASLADDHRLGELMQPVTLANTLVSTFARPAGWLEAWRHYYRWQKTVRWCRPIAYAALLLITPSLGWGAAGIVSADTDFFLSGLVLLMGGEILVAALACRQVGCRLPPATWIGVLLWPAIRATAWLLVWLPIPVVWSGRKRTWFAPEQE